jgi:hypothetical protein
MKLSKFKNIGFTKRRRNWIRSIWDRFTNRISVMKYWFVSHFIPSRKYHLLDLRQPKISGEYRYGWIDADHQILFALFNILNNFVKQEMPNWYCPSEEEISHDVSLLNQRNTYLEVKAIHYWWNIDRKRQESRRDHMIDDWHKARKAGSSQEHQLWEDLRKADRALDDKEDEMIGRLIKIRHALWT